eukprot:313948_1
MEINTVKVDYMSIQLEIYLSGLIAKLLSNKIIKKYKVNYFETFESELEGMSIEMFVTENKAAVNNAFVNHIYETNCISFMKLTLDYETILPLDDRTILFQIFAMDSDGNIIAQSQLKKIEPKIQSGWSFSVSNQKENICSYFDNEIDVNKKLNINLKDWVSAISNIEIFKRTFDEFDCKKMYHYIQNQKEIKLNVQNGANTIDSDDFSDFFVGNYDIQHAKYETVYKTFLQMFWKHCFNDGSLNGVTNMYDYTL